MLINTRMHHTRSLQATFPHAHMEWRQRGSKRETRLAGREEASDAEMVLELWWLQCTHFYLQLPRAVATTPTHAEQRGNLECFLGEGGNNPLCAAHVNCAHHPGLLASQKQPPAMDKVISNHQTHRVRNTAPVLPQKQPGPPFRGLKANALTSTHETTSGGRT